MDINGYNFDLGKAAHDIALIYAKKSLDPDFAHKDGDIDNMLQAYINAYLRVVSADSAWVKALIR